VPGKDRQRQLAREKLQRQMAKRAEAARRRRRAQATTGAALAVVAVIALAGFGVAKLNSRHKSAAPSTAPGTALCRYTKPSQAQAGQVPRKAKFPPITGVSKKGSTQVRLATNQGTLTVTLDRSKAPCTVNSFVSLVDQKYFDKSPCHRLTTSGIFVLQCGDPAGLGNGGPGYQFGEEGLPADTNKAVTYPAGTVAMANAGPGTNGSQFFVVYKDTQFPPNYTIFGTVSSGLDTVVKIAKAGAVNPAGKSTADGKPRKPVTIEQARVVS
jgi:peptidyl-prolyl cis-trans isomerase B (cyclophilin B)